MQPPAPARPKRVGEIRVTYFEEPVDKQEPLPSPQPSAAGLFVATPATPVASERTTTTPRAIAIPTQQTPAAAKFFDIEQTSVLELDGNEPLKPLASLSPDEKAERAQAMKIVRNRLTFEADAWFQFLQLLEGHIGQRASNWLGQANGSQAVVQIFTNVLSSLNASLSGVGPLTSSLASKKMQEDLENNFREGLASILGEAASKARGLDDEGVRALTSALFANLHAERDLKLLERAVKIVKEAAELPGDLIGPRVRQALGLGGGGLETVAPHVPGADPPIPLAPLRPTSKGHSLPVHLVGAGPVPPPVGGTVPLTATDLVEREVKAAGNADFQLYMALREGRVNEAWLKGFQMLYKRDADDQRINRSLEVVRAVERLLKSAGGRADSTYSNSVALYMVPENLGMLFLDPRIRTSIRAAHTDLCTIGNRPDVPIIDWATAESSVQGRFAELCSIKYHMPTGAAPFRGSSVYSMQSNMRDVELLCKELARARYVNNQLIFPEHRMGIIVRQQRHDARQSSFEATGRYTTGGSGEGFERRSLSALELGSQSGRKRPLGPTGLADARRRAQRAADQRLAAQLLLE